MAIAVHTSTARTNAEARTVLDRVFGIAESQSIELSKSQKKSIRDNLNGLGESQAVNSDWRPGNTIMECLERAASSAGKHLTTADRSRIRSLLNRVGLINYYEGLPGSRFGGS